jgi:membrane-associated protease RseP (regulator of RpoE activity)
MYISQYMKTKKTIRLIMASRLLWLGAIGALLAGCSSNKEKPVQARGWLGGEYKLVRYFPKLLTPKPDAGILVTALATNTPASSAGIRAGDVIFELDHQPFTRLQDFRRKIDASEPGTLMSVTLYRDSQTVQYDVPVGRETFNNNGVFMIGLPGFFHGPELWPYRDSPGLSLVALGYSVNPGHREELASIKRQYELKCNPAWKAYDEDYKIWLLFMEVKRGESIVAQESVEAKR